MRNCKQVVRWLLLGACCLSWLFLLPAVVLADDPPSKLLPPLETLPKNATADKKKDPFQEKYEDALRRLTRAQIALRNAKTDEEKAAAEKADKEAKRILTAISKQRNAAIRRMTFQARGLKHAANIREEVDPDDHRERFLLMAPQGPLIIEVDFLIDDAPYRRKREKFIDDRLNAADEDRDGEVSWEDALKHPGFTLNRLRIFNDQQRKHYLDLFDVDGDGLVSRYETRAFVAQMFQGPVFEVFGRNSYQLHGSTSYYMRNVLPPVNLWTLLDVDGDGRLSAHEVRESQSRLKSRDEDDNELIFPAEITGSITSNGRVRRPISINQPLPNLALLLGPTTAGDQIVDQLESRYQTQRKPDPAAKKNDLAIGVAATLDSLIADPDGWLHEIDLNKNGRLDAAEAQQINVHPAHLRATMRLGKTTKQRLVILYRSERLEEVSTSGDAITLQWKGTRVAINVSGRTQPPYDYKALGVNYVQRMDKNQDGYVGEDELTPQTAAMYKIWDQNRDGRIYAEEIQRVYEAMASPQWNRVTATVSPEGSALFRAIDVNGDLRIGAREMANAPQRLIAMDKDQDGSLVRDELPGTMNLRIALGGDQVVRGPSPQLASNAKAPDWFVRMDRNGDGDVTLKEFLGSPEAFQKLDKNQDGFISPDEVK